MLSFFPSGIYDWRTRWCGVRKGLCCNTNPDNLLFLYEVHNVFDIPSKMP